MVENRKAALIDSFIIGKTVWQLFLWVSNPQRLRPESAAFSSRFSFTVSARRLLRFWPRLKSGVVFTACSAAPERPKKRVIVSSIGVKQTGESRISIKLSLYTHPRSPEERSDQLLTVWASSLSTARTLLSRQWITLWWFTGLIRWVLTVTGKEIIIISI